jgi:hypothetical protein
LGFNPTQREFFSQLFAIDDVFGSRLDRAARTKSLISGTIAGLRAKAHNQLPVLDQ